MDEQRIKQDKAIALKYDIDVDNAPKIIGKGQGETAKNIIKIAKENNIPIKKDEDLVELLSKIDIDKEIPTSMFKAVAEIFSFIYEMSNKKEEIDRKIENKVLNNNTDWYKKSYIIIPKFKQTKH